MNAVKLIKGCIFYLNFLHLKVKLDVKIFIKTILKFCKRMMIKSAYEVKFLSNDFGFSRGIPVDRYYMHDFFCEYSYVISRKCLEFGDTAYIEKYGTNVTEKITFNYSNEFSSSKSNLFGDITELNMLPLGSFDCIVCVNVLNFIYDVSSALSGLQKMLNKNGKLVLTLAGVSSHISRFDMDRWGDYWRFTDLSAIKLIEDSGLTIESMKIYGNPYSCTAQTNGYSVEDLILSKLYPSHSDYQLLIAFVLSK